MSKKIVMLIPLVLALLLLSGLLVAPALAQSGDTLPKGTEAVLWSESFDGTTFPPTDWGRTIITDVSSTGTPTWTREIVGTYPTISPHSGAAMAKFNSFNVGAGDSARLYSQVLDLSGMTAPTLKFWMSCDIGYTNNDRIQVQLSTDGGASYVNLGAPFARYNAACATPTWVQRAVDLSAYTTYTNTRIGFLAISEYGSNIFFDDVSIESPEPNFTGSYKSAPAQAVMSDPITYTIYVTNSGNLAAGNASVYDAIPAGAAYIAGSLACTSGSCAYDGVGVAITWTGSLAVQDDVTITFAIDASGAACGSLANTAIISDPAASAPKSAQASTQLVYALPVLSESFDGTTFPPAGWTTAHVTGTSTYSWTRQTSGSSPTISPHSGAAMARYYSYMAPDGNAARLATSVLDLTGMTAPTLKFWMSHNSYNDTDRMQVQISTDGGASYVNLGSPILRYDATCTTACWKEHSVDLSAYTAYANTRLGFLGISGYGNNIFLDDVTIAEPWSPCPSLSIEPDQSKAACKGNTVDYSLTVVNANDAADVIDIAVAGDAWPTSLSATSLSLGPGALGVVTVSVFVPWATTPFDTDAITVTATAQTSGLSDEAQIETIAQLAAGYTDYADVPSTDGYQTRDHSVVYYDGKLYKFGGYGGATGAARAFTLIYDIASNTWYTGTSMPAARYWIDCVEIGGKFYCAGGYTGSAASNSLYIYHPITNTWTTGAVLPAARYAYDGVALDGKYYVIGGYTSSYQNTILVYDPATDTWDSTKASMSVARRDASAGVIGGKIYVAGGRSAASTYLSSAEVYSPTADTWSPIASIPSPWLNAADGVKHGRYLVLAGGSATSSSGYSVRALAYDAVQNNWQWLLDMDHSLYGAEGDTDGNGDFWVVSGRGTNYSPYTFMMDQCPDCVPPSNAGFGTDPLSPMAGAPITFTGSADGSGPFTFDWDMGDTTLLMGNPIVHTYVASNTYTVVMTVTGACGTDVYSDTVFASSTATPPDITLASSSPTALGNATYFTGTLLAGSPPVSYMWNYGDGTVVAGGLSSNHTYTQTGMFTVILTATNGGGYDVATTTVDVGNAPTVAFASSSPTTYPAATVFTYTGNYATSWLWSFGDGVTSTLENPAHTYAAPLNVNLYNVTLQVWNGYGAAQTSGQVTVYHYYPIFVGSKTGPSAYTAPDALLNYTIRVTNTGNIAASAASIVDTFPVGSTGPAINVTASAGSVVANTATDLTWNGALGIGQGLTLTFSLTPTAGCGGIVLANTAVVSDPLALVPLDLSAPGTTLQTVLLSEGFEGATFPPDGWTRHNSDGGGTQWARNTTASYVHSGIASAYHAYSTAGMQDGWLATPAIAVPTGLTSLTFWEYTGYPTFYYSHTVWICSGSSCEDPPFNYTLLAEYDNPEALWRQQSLDLNAYSGQTVRLAFRYMGNNADNWYIDDVQISQPCPYLTIGPDVSNTVCPGDSTVYTMTVFNGTDAADTINIALNPASPAWTSVEPASLALGPYASGIVTITVNVPWGAMPGSADYVVLTATGAGSGLSDSAFVETVVLNDGWEDKSPSPTGARYPGLAYYDGFLYQIGGQITSNTGPAITNTYRYDIAADTWYTLTGLITRVYGVDPVAIGGNIYVPGGYNGSAYINSLQVYSTTANTWSAAASLPANLGYYQGVALDGKLYVIGGYRSTAPAGVTNTLSIYDPQTNVWTTGAPMLGRREYAAAGVMGGKIYVAGGSSTGSDALSTAEVYNPATNMWSSVTPVPTLWANGADAVLYDRYLVIGGGNGTPATASNWTIAYDAVTNQWMQLPVLNSMRYGSGADGDGTDVYIVAGREYDGTWLMSPRNEHMTWCPACEAPDVTFGYSPMTPTPGATVYFSATLNAGTQPVAYEWNFDDGNTATGQYATNVYAATGDYVVVLTATNICGLVDVYTRTVTVSPATPPTAAFTSNSPVLLGNPMQFTNQSVGAPPLYYAWDFGDGVGVSTAQDPSYTYADAGFYTVTLVVTNAYGTDDVSHVVEVTEAGVAPTAGFTNNSPVVLGSPMQFTNTSVGTTPRYYSWDFGDGVGVSTAQDPSYTYADYGAYTVTLVVTNAFGSDDVSHVVEVGTAPSCAFTNDGPVALGDPIHFSSVATGTEPISYEWDLGDGLGISADPNPVYTYTAANTYTVWLTVTNAWGVGACSGEAVVLGVEPTADFESTCPDVLGETSYFTNTSTGSLPFTDFVWLFGDSGSASTQNASHAYTSVGTYTVQLTVSNAYGTDSVQKTCIIQPTCTPVTDVGFSYDPMTIYAGDTVTFTAVYTPSGATTPVDVDWELDGVGMGSGTQISHLFATVGAYTVTVMADNCSGAGHAQYEQALTVLGSTPTYYIYLPIVLRNSP